MKKYVKIIKGIYHKEPQNLEFLSKGFFSEAYRFKINDESLILRIGVRELPFQKDKFISQRIGDRVKVAHILKTGEIEDKFYSIHKDIAGYYIQDVDLAKNEKLLRSLLDEAVKIYKTDISDTKGFGTFDETGNAKAHSFIETFKDFKTWHTDFLSRPGEDFMPFNETFNNSFVDPMRVEKLKTLMLKNLEKLPTKRYLYHGDFGFDNVIAQDDEVTGIIDWAESGYGDFLKDIANIDYWRGDRFVSEYFFENYKDSELQPEADQLLADDFTNYNIRIDTYLADIALSSFYLYVNRDQKDWFEEDRKRLKLLLDI
jgi:hygromycin-B 4-O-kinase